MSKDKITPDEMNYEQMAQEALRGVVKAALQRAASPAGIPGAHHFYVSFKTTASGVSIPSDLLAKFPEEMTIVLQHQFWDLAPGDTQFSITLSFGGQPKRLTVPYAALTRFFDPSVQFLLQFDVPDFDPPVQEEPEAEADAPAATTDSGDEGPKIVSLDQFRKK